MLQEYNFLSEIGDILSIYYDGLDDAFFVSNAKSLKALKVSIPFCMELTN